MPPAPDHTRAPRTDGEQWDVLVHRYAGLVWSVPRGHGFDSATSSQIAQTCWLRLVEQVDEIAAPAVGEWLLRAARQESARAARWHDGGRDAGRSALTTDPLLQALADLPARLRLALRVAAAEPSRAELGAALDLPDDAVPTALAQGMERLAALAGGDPGPPDVLTRALHRAVADHDGAPAELMAAARAAFSWRTLDAELAPLTDESSHDDVLAGVRGGPGLRQLSFSVDGLVVVLEVSVEGLRRSVLGQLAPADATEVVLRLADGAARDVDVDDLGRFVCDDLPPGQVSLRVVDAGTGRSRHTDWVLL